MTPRPAAARRAIPPGSIVHVLDHALPELSGYSVRSHNLLRALRDHGLPVVGLAPASDAAARDEDIDGVSYARLPRRASTLGSVPRLFGLCGDLRSRLRGQQVALIHAHSPVRSGLPAFYAARRAGVPLIYDWRGIWEESGVERRSMRRGLLRYRVSRDLETWLMRRVDALAAISHGQIGEARRRGVAPDRIFHAPNGVDTDAFRPQPADAELSERYGLRGGIVIGCIGFFFAYEGIDVLVRAFAQLRSHRPDARLLLVGDGDMHDELRAQVRGLRLDAHVIMTGRVPHADVPRYYSLCDVLVYPRRRGPMMELVAPLRPLEAMSMCKPVIASDLGALREIVRDGDTGVLFAADDADSLTAALTALAADPALRDRLGAGGRRFAEQRDWRHLAAVYARVYARLLGSPRSAGAALPAPSENRPPATRLCP